MKVAPIKPWLFYNLASMYCFVTFKYIAGGNIKYLPYMYCYKMSMLNVFANAHQERKLNIESNYKTNENMHIWTYHEKGKFSCITMMQQKCLGENTPLAESLSQG